MAPTIPSLNHDGNAIGRVPLQLFSTLLQNVDSTHTPLPDVKTLPSMQDTFAAALSTTRHDLNRQQSYISRLPVELLIVIFRLVVDETTPRPANDPRHAMFAGTYPATNTLLTLTHVCQYWRDILVQQPSFWTVVTSNNMNAAETFLRRSGDDLPIVVHMDTIGPPGQFIVVPPFLREYRLQPRLREIHWIMREDTPRKADYLLFPAPRLELLRILYDAEDEERDEVYRHMPPILFAGHAPLLRTVYLGRIGWLPGNRFQSLTFLRLADIPLEFRGFVRLLSNCPVLEHLHLLRIDATAPPDRPLMPELAIGQATLPRLHCFAFKDMHTASVNDFLFYFAGHRADVSVHVVGIPRAALQPVVVIRTLAREAYGALTSLTLQYHIHNADVVSILATGPGVAIDLVSHPTVAEVVDGVHYYYPPLHWGMRQLEAFPLDILQHVCFKYLNVRTSPTNQSLPPARTVRYLIVRMTRLQELQLVTDDLPLLFSQVFSNSDDTALLPLWSEAPRWRLPVLSIKLIPPAGTPPDPDLQLARPDLSNVLRVVGRIVFTIPPPVEVFDDLLTGLIDLQWLWGEERITTVLAD